MIAPAAAMLTVLKRRRSPGTSWSGSGRGGGVRLWQRGLAGESKRRRCGSLRGGDPAAEAGRRGRAGWKRLDDAVLPAVQEDRGAETGWRRGLPAVLKNTDRRLSSWIGDQDRGRARSLRPGGGAWIYRGGATQLRVAHGWKGGGACRAASGDRTRGGRGTASGGGKRTGQGRLDWAARGERKKTRQLG